MNKAPTVRAWAAPLAPLVCALLVSSGGCVVETGTSAAGASPGVAVSGPPPAPMREAPPPPVQPPALWIPGYWHWTGMQYTWIPGHWENERPGARWRAPRYFMREGVYYYAPGAWLAPMP